MYQVSIGSKQEKKLGKLKKSGSKAIFKKLESLCQNPYRGKPLKGDLVGIYSARVDPYRILYLIDKVSKTLIIVDIGLRSDVYDRDLT